MSKGHQNNKTVSNRTLINKLKLHSRMEVVEKQLTKVLEDRKREADFLAGMMFGVNGLARALMDKNVITRDELDDARIKEVEAYRDSRAEELRMNKVAEQYKNDPVHYDSTTDKWFVFAPNWKDKVGPFLNREAAEEAKRTIESPVNKEVESVNQ